jgi:hypothetical protein
MVVLYSECSAVTERGNKKFTTKVPGYSNGLSLFCLSSKLEKSYNVSELRGVGMPGTNPIVV